MSAHLIHNSDSARRLHRTTALAVNPTFGAFPIRKTSAISTDAAYTEDLDLEDILNSALRLRD